MVNISLDDNELFVIERKFAYFFELVLPTRYPKKFFSSMLADIHSIFNSKCFPYMNSF